MLDFPDPEGRVSIEVVVMVVVDTNVLSELIQPAPDTVIASWAGSWTCYFNPAPHGDQRGGIALKLLYSPWRDTLAARHGKIRSDFQATGFVTGRIEACHRGGDIHGVAPEAVELGDDQDISVWPGIPSLTLRTACTAESP